jgi:hypothetical protein
MRDLKALSMKKREKVRPISPFYTFAVLIVSSGYLFVPDDPFPPYRIQGDYRCQNRSRVPRSFRVFDSIMYGGEAHLFFLRLVTLDPYVDYFVVGYLCYTFQGAPAGPISFEPFESEIAQYSDKIKIFHACRGFKKSKHSWNREWGLREFLRDSVASLQPNPEDLVISCDCDEIPTRRGLDAIFADPPKDFYKFRGSYFTFSFRLYSPSSPWIKAGIVRWSAIGSLQSLRRSKSRVVSGVSLIHCSYCSPTIGMIVKKLKAFCHHEFAFEPFINPNYILASVKCGKSLIPTQRDLTAPYLGNIDEFLPVRHPKLEFLREKVGFSDLETTDEKNVTEFMRFLNCTT